MNLAKRCIVAAVGVPVIYLLARLGGWYFLCFVSIQIAFASSEFFTLSRRKGLPPLTSFGIVLAAAVPLAPFLARTGGALEWLALAWAAAALIIPVASLGCKDPCAGALARASVTLFGVLYIGGLLSFQVLLRHWPGLDNYQGFCWVFLVYLLTWSVDVGGYAVGTLFGRHKLFPAVSPGKTVEGTLGGLLASAGVSWAVGAHWMGLLDLVPALELGLLLGLAAPLGDLVESSFKRDAGVKDSSCLIPGHGGVLDRFDSLIFTAPLAFVFRSLFL